MWALEAFGGPVEAVFLDVGGVFHLPAPEIVGPALRRAGLEGPIDGAVLDRAHYPGAKALEVWPEGDVGLWAAYERAYAVEAGVPDECVDEAVAELDLAFAEKGVWSRPAPGSLEGLRRLYGVAAQAGVQLAIVSNSDGTLEGRLRQEGICQVGPGPGVPMTIVIDSDVVGVAKPDPAIFTIALDACGVAPDRALHVGDTVGADVDGALAAGVRPVHLDPYGFCADGTHVHVADLAAVAAHLGDSRVR